MNDKEQTEQDLKEFDEVFNNKTINKMTAKEARELSKTVSPEMVSSILEEIKNQAKNGEYSLYYNSGRINDVDMGFNLKTAIILSSCFAEWISVY